VASNIGTDGSLGIGGGSELDGGVDDAEVLVWTGSVGGEGSTVEGGDCAWVSASPPTGGGVAATIRAASSFSLAPLLALGF